MKAKSYKFTKERKILCLTILFFTVIFTPMGIFCLSVYCEGKKIVDKEISEIDDFQKNQKLKPLSINQAQQSCDSILIELSTNLPKIDMSESTDIELECNEAVESFLEIPRVFTPLEELSLDCINDILIYFSSTSLAYSRILSSCINEQVKHMIEFKNYNIQVLKRLINFMLSKETFGVYVDSILTLHSMLKSVKENDIGCTQSFFVIYTKEFQGLNDAIRQVVQFTKTKKEALLRLYEYLNTNVSINLTEVTRILENRQDEKKPECFIFGAFMRTVKAIPILLMESIIKYFYDINVENGSTKLKVNIKGKYKGTKFENKLENFNIKHPLRIGFSLTFLGEYFISIETKKTVKWGITKQKFMNWQKVCVEQSVNL